MEPSLRRSLGLVVVLGAVTACRSRSLSSTVAPDPGVDAAAVVVHAASASASASAPAPSPPSDAGALAAVDAGASPCSAANVPKVLARIPCVSPRGEELMIEARQVGFSKDGRYLGMCISKCDPCPLSCDFDDAVARKRINVRFAYGPEEPGGDTLPPEVLEQRMKARDARAQKFLDDAGFAVVGHVRKLTGTWPHPDMVFAARAEADEKNGTAVLDFGASVDGAEPVYPIHIVIGPQSTWRGAPVSERGNYALAAPELAYVDLSPDGKDLGVVAFTTGSMWYEDAKWQRMPVAGFAARAYELTAAQAKKKGDNTTAATLLEKAAAARKR